MSASDQRRDHLTIDIERELRRKIEEKAASQGRSLREYVEDILTRSVEAGGLVTDTDKPDTPRVHVPPMTAEERARGLRVIAEIQRRGDPRTIKPGTPTVDSLELIHAARDERTRHLSRLAGLDEE